MIYISHRGNINGRSEKENQPEYIDDAINSGYNVEIDIRIIGKDYYLGHDFPQFKISYLWLDDRKENLLLHVKDYNFFLNRYNNDWHYFCHTNDPFTITSKKYIWIHDLSLSINDNSIVPLISKELVSSYDKNVSIVCSDFILDCKNKFGD